VHECFLRSGQIFCLGGDDFRALGAPTLQVTGCVGMCSLTPVAADTSVHTFERVGSGPYSFHTCAAGTTGVSCWGRNDHEQCGSDTGGASVASPTAVGGLASMHVTAIATGDASTCVIANGDVYCWGLNVSGQLGRGPSGPDSPTPMRVMIP
jgi:alpha-tubulin suppressor-like RCC1 family protein